MALGDAPLILAPNAVEGVAHQEDRFVELRQATALALHVVRMKASEQKALCHMCMWMHFDDTNCLVACKFTRELFDQSAIRVNTP